jgi:hypothetical protein
VGLLAAWLVALSPFTILFAPTAFVDPLLVALILACCLAAASGQAARAGLWLGLAFATKQQAILFVPLALALGGLGTGAWRSSLTSLGVAGLTFLPALGWDWVRGQSPGFLAQSVTNYGGLQTDLAAFGERWWGFVGLLTYGTASPLLNGIFLAGLPLLLGYGLWRGGRAAKADRILAAFSLGYLLFHALWSFQVWDRYLLGLIPFLALLLARVLLLPGAMPPHPLATAGRLSLVLLLCLTLAGPVQDAANGRYPLGSHSQALAGIEQIVAYLRRHAGGDDTLYHRWLGTHWRFYLWGYPYYLIPWTSAQQLARQALPGQLITFPSWRSETEARLALAGVNLELRELTRAYTPTGHPSIILYRIERCHTCD